MALADRPVPLVTAWNRPPLSGPSGNDNGPESNLEAIRHPVRHRTSISLEEAF